MVQVLLRFSQAYQNFRTAEFTSLCRLLNLTPSYDEKLLQRTPLLPIEVHTTNDAVQLLSRALLLKRAYEVFAHASDQEQLLKKLKEEKTLCDRLKKYDKPEAPWAMRVECVGAKQSQEDITATIEKFASHVNLEKAPINLKSPVNTFVVVKNLCAVDSHSQSHVYFCRLIGEGQAALKSRYDLKDRIYIGNSTMDPELSLIQSNLTQCRPKTLAFDPFCGTGGLMLAASHHGSWALGSEINYQVARAVGKSSRAGQKLLTSEQSILANFKQYGLENRFLGVVLADSSQHALWYGTAEGLFDCIITDPPYGVREKGRRLGTKKNSKREEMDNPGSAEWTGEHYPEKVKYSISDVYLDLLNLSAHLLAVGGRLTFWFPVMRRNYSDKMIPHHPCMQLLHNCEQWLANDASRRLLVYEKKHMGSSQDIPSVSGKAHYPVNGYAEKTFRERVFRNQNVANSKQEHIKEV